MPKIGPSFSAELAAAGIPSLPIGWGEDGIIVGREALTSEQSATLDAVIAAHDPTKKSKAEIKTQIAALESTQHRAVREATLGVTGALAKLQDLDAKITALRVQLT